MPIEGFEARLAAAAAAVDAALGRLIDARPARGRPDAVAPDRLIEAARYAVLGGGKRFRPFLVMETAALFGSDAAAALRTACAFECLHCYSLVHDDLPAMDNDDLRRGKPTVHKAFGEATAILVGDGLLTFAFELLASLPGSLPQAARLDLIRLLAGAAGFDGMVGGQFRDLNPSDDLSLDGVRLLQRMKTGALIRAACEAGAVLGGADEADGERMRAYGSAIGEAFQLADDLLDLEGAERQTGKRTGKDSQMGKATIPGLVGLAESRQQLVQLVDQAERALAAYGPRAGVLLDAARFVASRSS